MLACLKSGCLIAVGALACLLYPAHRCAAQRALPSTHPVRGIVEDRQTHQPIARALVETGEAAMLTDSEGRFEFDLHEGVTFFLVRRPGYDSDQSGRQHSVKVSADLPSLTFYLTRSASISGHVTASNDDDIEGLSFVTYRKNVLHGHTQWGVADSSGSVDADGGFKLVELSAPGTYVFCNHESGRADASSGRHVTSFPSLCFPGGTDFASVTPLRISAGQQAEVDITLARQPLYPVAIAVQNRAEGYRQGVDIYDRGGRPISAGIRWNEQLGTANLDLPNGSYFAASQSFRPKPWYGRVDFTVTGAPLNLSIVPLPINSIPVEVRKEFTGEQAKNQVAFAQAPGMRGVPGVSLFLLSTNAMASGPVMGMVRKQEGGADDSYVVDALPGRYWVQANAFQGYVSSITSGGVDLAREPLVVGPGGASRPIEVTLRDDGGMIECALSQNPVAGASVTAEPIFVYALPLFPSATRISETVAFGRGESRFSNLAPGSYRVMAFDAAQQIDLDDAESLAHFNTLGQTVTVAAGSTANVQLEVIRTNNDEEGQ